MKSISKSFCLIFMLLSCILSSCAQIKVNSLPEPPPTNALRVYFQPVSGLFPNGRWGTPHEVFVNKQANFVRNILKDTGYFQLVDREDIYAAIGNEQLYRWDLEKNGWELARRIGRAVHADYVLVGERGKFTGPEFYWSSALINVETGKVFGGSLSHIIRYPLTVKVDKTEEWHDAMKAAYREIFNEAKGDLLAMAIKKKNRISADTGEPPAIEQNINLTESETESALKKQEQERLTAENLAKENAERERLAAEEFARRKQEEERRTAERFAQEKAELERLAAEALAKAGLEEERRAAERIAIEQAERERLATEELARKMQEARSTAERIAREAAEQERFAAEELVRRKQEEERSAIEKLALEKAEKERIAAEEFALRKQAEERQAAEQIAHEKAERERNAAEAFAREKQEEQQRLADMPVEAKETEMDKGKIRLVVYDLESAELLRPIAMILSEALREEFIKLGRFQLVNRENLSKVLQELELRNSGLIDEKQAVQLGKGLSAREVVTGRLGSLGKSYVLQAKRISAESFRTISIESLKSSLGEEDHLLDGIPSLAGRLGRSKTDGL